MSQPSQVRALQSMCQPQDKGARGNYHAALMLQLRSGPVWTIHLLVMTTVQGVSCSISHELRTSVSSI